MDTKLTKIQIKLRKLLALADQGVGGERDNAARILQDLLKLYGMTMDDIREEKTETRWFRFENKYEKRLINQLAFKVTDDPDCKIWRNPKYPKERAVDLTNAQWVEMQVLYGRYKKALENEFEFFFSAFIQQNRIFGTGNTDPRDWDELTPDEQRRIEKIQQMMNGVDVVPVHKELKGGANA